MAFVELDYFGEADFFFFFGEVVNHELKMRLEFCYRSAVLALNNKKLDHFKFLRMPFTSHPAAFHKKKKHNLFLACVLYIFKHFKSSSPRV